MKQTANGFALILSSTTLCTALAAPGLGAGPEPACSALSELTRQAVALKKQGVPVDKAITVLSSQPAPDIVPPGQLEFYRKQLPGAARFAYVAGMSGDGAARYYLDQCRKGS